MKCPNCNSSMFVSNKTAAGKSLVTFFRCSTCVGEHVTSELTNDDSNYETSRLEFFEADSVNKIKHVQML